MNTGNKALKDVVGIGNAMVDVLAHADEAFLAHHGLAKGAMTLVDAPRAAGIHKAMGHAVEMSGGSVGNTMAGLAALGGTGSYIGKVHNDQLGRIFHHDLESLGITFSTAPALDGAPTARCLVIVTPDGQRSMATYLGACTELGPEDIAAETICGHRVTYLEGYLWDSPRAREAMVKAARIAHAAGGQVALTLSDPFCVDRHRDSFRDLILNHVDILFANEAEIISLYQARDVYAALERGRGDCRVVAVTRSEKGSLIASGDMVYPVNIVPVEWVVDTTGAGDLYAAGVLFGITHGYDLAKSGRIGAIAAAEIVSHLGARPEANLSELVQQSL
ncbi:MAG: adenosine kinase [Dehalococcoidia bacterium]|nr:adenosine kinase [Dehalococcoidia bacterium]